MNMEEEKVLCYSCNEETIPVYFNDDKRYENIQYVRCMKCNQIFPIKITNK